MTILSMREPGIEERVQSALAGDFDFYPSLSKALIAQGIEAKKAIFAVLATEHQFAVKSWWHNARSVEGENNTLRTPRSNTREILREVYRLSPSETGALSDQVRALVAFDFDLKFSKRVSQRIKHEYALDQADLESGRYGHCDACGANLPAAGDFCQACGQRFDVLSLSDDHLQARETYSVLPARLYHWARRALDQAADARDPYDAKADHLRAWLQDFGDMGFIALRSEIPSLVSFIELDRSRVNAFYQDPFPDLDIAEIVAQVLSHEPANPDALRARFESAERQRKFEEAKANAARVAKDTQDADTLRRRFFQRLIDCGYSEQEIEAMTSLSEILAALARPPSA